MNKIKLGLLALISIAGVGAAFASSHKARFAKTYYGVLTAPGKVKWVTVLPANKICDDYTAFACVITSAVATATVKALTNAFPLTHRTVSNPGKVYQ